MVYINDQGEIIRDDAEQSAPGRSRQRPNPSRRGFLESIGDRRSQIFVGSIGGYLTGAVSGSILGGLLFVMRAISSGASTSSPEYFSATASVIWIIVTVLGSLVFIGIQDSDEAGALRDAFHREIGSFFEKLFSGAAACVGLVIGGMIVSIIFFVPVAIILFILLGGLIVYVVSFFFGCFLTVVLGGVIGGVAGFLLGGLAGVVCGSITRT